MVLDLFIQLIIYGQWIYCRIGSNRLKNIARPMCPSSLWGINMISRKKKSSCRTTPPMNSLSRMVYKSSECPQRMETSLKMLSIIFLMLSIKKFSRLIPVEQVELMAKGTLESICVRRTRKKASYHCRLAVQSNRTWFHSKAF